MDLFKLQAMVPMPASMSPAWLSWVGATAGCLKALGIETDNAEVAALSGYAFCFTINEGLCVSGPTVVDWSALNWGPGLLGRSTICFQSGDCHTKELANERTREHCRQAFELAAREVAAGRPCVMWGAYVPEFAVVKGVDNGCYIVSSFKEAHGEEQPPVPYDEINAPGGPFTLAFPTATPSENRTGYRDHYAVGRAVQLLSQPSASPKYETGLAAYGTWIAALEGRKADGFGNAYNAQCWAEAKHFAAEYLARLVPRYPGVRAELQEAAEAYAATAGAMARVARLFPFGKFDAVKDAAVCAEACQALLDAKAAESKAVVAMRSAYKGSWAPEGAAAP